MQRWSREWNRIIGLQMYPDSTLKVIHRAKCIGEQDEDTLMPVSVNATACVEFCDGSNVIPYTNGNRNILFQRDNACPHIAHVVWDELQQRNVAILPWPTISPDLAPGSFHGVRYTTNGLFIDLEATVGTYELRSYGGEQ